ncbi:glucose dehydrogenase [FAD, quinone]-like isoform X2 [Ornithodoros turicata]|uniref:glucose dehydrogenase [FAD, quinone]-like isoform X2 n=1 Tax=Ornithodoros turicata TaxID=34597 RepID=UPI003138E4C9
MLSTKWCMLDSDAWTMVFAYLIGLPAVVLQSLLGLLDIMNLPPADFYYEKGIIEFQSEYDFVIVGGGSSGCVVANRLSANPNVSVLLIEAGRAEDLIARIPLASLVHTYDFSWWSRTVPQHSACLAYEDHSCPTIRGRVLGGGSVINAMQFVRANRRDYDDWASNGAEGWAYDDVLPYFKSIERFEISQFYEEAYHSKTGEVPDNYAPFRSQLSRAYLQGLTDVGYNVIDYNGASQTGHSFTQFNQDRGERFSSSRAFITPVIQERDNLRVTLRSVATKVRFDGQRAIGVEYVKGGLPRYAKARREVILCAGAIGTPQLLMLSGIGPTDELQRFEIPVRANLPVGRNLQDHHITGGVAATMEENAGIDARNLSMASDYFISRSGPLTVNAGVEIQAFFKSALATPENDRPDTQAFLVSLSPATAEAELGSRALGIRQDVYDAYFRPNRDKFCFMIVPIVLRPASRGSVTLRSANYEDSPVVDPRYFSHPDDIRAAVEGAKEAMKVLYTPPMRALGVKPWNLTMPGCEGHELWSDPYIACLSMHLTETAWHFVGTCAMGNGTDAVVDARLSVIAGIKGLRVVDCSIMPNIVSGNTNVPAMMIGAKGAAMILQDHGLYDPNSM